MTRAFGRRCAACLALVPLLLQLALSFAHVHKHDIVPSEHDRTEMASVGHALGMRQAFEKLPVRVADDDDHCLICFSNFLISGSSIPDTPADPRLLKVAAITRAFTKISDRLFEPRHSAFQSRAPPLG